MAHATSEHVSRRSLQLTYDPDADALYVRLAAAPADRSEELGDGRRVDYVGDEPVGVEFQHIRAGIRTDGLPATLAALSAAGFAFATAAQAVRDFSFPDEQWRQMEREADADIAAGRIMRFDDAESLLAYLNRDRRLNSRLRPPSTPTISVSTSTKRPCSLTWSAPSTEHTRHEVIDRSLFGPHTSESVPSLAFQASTR